MLIALRQKKAERDQQGRARRPICRLTLLDATTWAGCRSESG
uniref:Uncharacterized protein n=1 Tax=Arundo donax TaxID=35708 RepID=A0A0A9EJ18_ARUDO